MGIRNILLPGTWAAWKHLEVPGHGDFRPGEEWLHLVYPEGICLLGQRGLRPQSRRWRRAAGPGWSGKDCTSHWPHVSWFFLVCVCLAPGCVLIGVSNRNLGNLAWIDSMYRMKLLIEKCPRSKVPKPQNKVDFGWFFGCMSERINGWFMLQVFWCNTMEQRFMLREPGFGYVGPVASFQGMCCCHYFCTFGRLERWCLLILPKQWRAHIIGQCM